MRTTMFAISIAGLAASTVGACKWTEFDDLENTTWVTSNGKPDVKSSNWGVAIQRGADASESGSSGALAVIGAGQPTYSEFTYDQTGAAKFGSNSLLLGGQGIMTLDEPPIFLASPKSAELALITTGDAASIVVATGSHTLTVRQLFVGVTSLGNTVTISSTPDAATYLQPAPFPGNTVASPAPLVAVADIVMGTIVSPPAGSKQPACKLTDGGNSIQIRALGVVRAPAATTDDVLVWNGVDGKLLRYPGSVFNGCVSQAPMDPKTGTKPAFTPGRGSQILTIDANRVLLQGRQDSTKGNGSFLQVYDSATLNPIGDAVATDGMRSAAILAVGATQYVVAGFPTELIDGTAAGQVLVYRIGTGGLETTRVATLHDAQPEDKENFGRAVVAMPYRGHEVIAVSADNEIFVYFQAMLEDGSWLYEETRQGR